MRAFLPSAVIEKVGEVAVALEHAIDDAAARDAGAGDDEQVQQQLDPILRHQQARAGPGKTELVVVHEALGHLLGVARVDGGAGRSRRAEGDARELQAGRGRLCALVDQVQREVAHALVLFLGKDFEAIHDGSDGADHVMADATAQKGSEIERIKLNHGHGEPASLERASGAPA